MASWTGSRGSAQTIANSKSLKGVGAGFRAHDQGKLLLQIEGRAKVHANHQIEFDCMVGVNFDLELVVEAGA